MEKTIINSKNEAMSFWVNEYGEPQSFTSYDELVNVEIKLNNLEIEDEKLKREIASRNVEGMNEYKINRSIELYFLIKSGNEYFDKCIKYVDIEEKKYETEYDDYYRKLNEYEDRWRDDSLFLKNYED